MVDLHKWRWLVEPLTVTVCVVCVLLITAGTPDADEITRGTPAALIGWWIGKLTRKD